MTGFGSAAHRDRHLDIEVETRSVNHRFITLKQNLAEGLTRREGEVEQMVRSRLARGSVAVTVSVKSLEPAVPALPDLKVLRATAKRLREIQKALGIKGDLAFENLLAIPTLWLDSRAEVSQADLWPQARKLIDRALEQLVAMRGREGEKIARDLQARLDTIEDRLARIEQRAPSVTEAYQKKLDDRIHAILAQKGLEAVPTDIVKEVALHADRIDISEEIQRLRAHIGEFRKVLRIKGQVGRRLDFLTQEMGRETNTIASKGNDAEVSTSAVEIKAEIEKIKEQVDNVE